MFAIFKSAQSSSEVSPSYAEYLIWDSVIPDLPRKHRVTFDFP